MNHPRIGIPITEEFLHALVRVADLANEASPLDEGWDYTETRDWREDMEKAVRQVDILEEAMIVERDTKQLKDWEDGQKGKP